MKRYFYFILASILAFCGCEERIHLESQDGKKLILNAMLSTRDTLHRAFISFGTMDDILPAADGELECYVNGELAGTGSLEFSDGKPSGIPFVAGIRPGDKVRLVVTTSEGYKAEATALAPKSAEILSVKTDSVTTQLPGDKEVKDYIRFRATIRDIPGEDNWYRIHMMSDSRTILVALSDYSQFHPEDLGTAIRSHRGPVEVSNYFDPLLYKGLSLSKEEDLSELNYFANVLNIFDDKSIRDSEYESTLLFESNNLSHYNGILYLYPKTWSGGDRFIAKCSLMLRLASMDRKTFNYLNAIQFERSELSAPIVGQDPIPSNVKGGIGYVCILSETEYVIPFPDFEIK